MEKQFWCDHQKINKNVTLFVEQFGSPPLRAFIWLRGSEYCSHKAFCGHSVNQLALYPKETCPACRALDNGSL